MSDTLRDTARTHLRALQDMLKRIDLDQTRRLASDCDHLIRAIETFHMENIRFRMFTLSRQIESLGAAVPPEASTLLEEARTALQAAGFKTR